MGRHSQQNLRLTVRFQLFPIIIGPACRSKLGSSSNDYMIVPAGAADDLDIFHSHPNRL